MLSALYFDDRLAAVELSLRSHEVLHGWFAAYNPEFSKYSPGTLLAVRIAEAAESLGIRRIEWGKNNLPYKESFATGSYPVGKGVVVVNPFLRVWRHGHVAARRLSETPMLRGTRRLARRIVHPARNWLALRSHPTATGSSSARARTEWHSPPRVSPALRARLSPAPLRGPAQHSGS